MSGKRRQIYSASGLSNKIEKMKLSKREAYQMKNAINELETRSSDTLMEMGKVHKANGTDNIYRINRRMRLMISPIKEIKQVV